jgi:hypothetical protein
MSLILNFHTEISIIEGDPQTLPQIKIDDVTAMICPVCAPHYNMQIRDMCSVYYLSQTNELVTTILYHYQ